MLRGINRQTIFEADEDCEKYLQCLTEYKSLSGFTLHAYRLMGNHVHLLIQEGKEPSGANVQADRRALCLLVQLEIQARQVSVPAPFQEQAGQRRCLFLLVLRYIYQNPVRAKLCKRPADYPWSSCRSLTEPHSLALAEKSCSIRQLSRLTVVSDVRTQSAEETIA